MSRAVPTREQLEWADCELGAIFHYDITVFEQDYRFRRSWGYQPSPQSLRPMRLIQISGSEPWQRQAFDMPFWWQSIALVSPYFQAARIHTMWAIRLMGRIL